MLQIQFNEIPENGVRLNIDDISWFPDQEMTRCSEPEAVVNLKRSGDRVLVNGSIRVALVFYCDRCLEKFTSPQGLDFQLVLEVTGPEGDFSDRQDVEIEFDSGQIEVLAFDGHSIDLGELLYQQMILAVPQKNLCRFDCRGICEHCGTNLNSQPCSCSGEVAMSPFAALNQLLKNNK